MDTKTGTSLFGWLLYFIFSSIALKYVVESYMGTSEIEWIPLVGIACLGIGGVLFQFLPSRNLDTGYGGSNTIIPPTDTSGSNDGGF